jgi:hypothetical protein
VDFGWSGFVYGIWCVVGLEGNKRWTGIWLHYLKQNIYAYLFEPIWLASGLGTSKHSACTTTSGCTNGKPYSKSAYSEFRRNDAAYMDVNKRDFVYNDGRALVGGAWLPRHERL